MVLVAVIAVGCVFGFLFMTAIGSIQDALNPMIEEGLSVSEEHLNTFSLAATLVTNLWTYIIAFIFIVAAYWAYIYSQRRSAGF
jgi:uncharacterized BrkB/YihY/UPF0761 family membrane protein